MDSADLFRLRCCRRDVGVQRFLRSSVLRVDDACRRLGRTDVLWRHAISSGHADGHSGAKFPDRQVSLRSRCLWRGRFVVGNFLSHEQF